MNLTTLRRPLPALAVGVLALALVGGGTAVAADFVTSRDVKDDSLRSADVKDGSLRVKDLSDAAVLGFQQRGIRGFTGAVGAGGARGVLGATGATGAQGTKGDQGAQGPAGAAAKTGLPNWGVVHRNVVANGDSSLATESQKPPLGTGALDLRTGPVIGANQGDKAAFGNEKDFAGQALSGITQLGYSVFTTGENVAAGGSSPNMPSLGLEVDPSGSASSTAPNFSTLVFIPNNTAANVWTAIDATSAAAGFQGGGWFYTGAAGTASGCNQTTFCTLAQAKAAYPNAAIFTVQLTKGRDFAFSGAVDALVINAQTFDFEQNGVFLK